MAVKRNYFALANRIIMWRSKYSFALIYCIITDATKLILTIGVGATDWCLIAAKMLMLILKCGISFTLKQAVPSSILYSQRLNPVRA